jgi:hypothetical protein
VTLAPDMKLERAKGIEPSYAAWEAAVLPLNYARKLIRQNQAFLSFFNPILPCDILTS